MPPVKVVMHTVKSGPNCFHTLNRSQDVLKSTNMPDLFWPCFTKCFFPSDLKSLVHGILDYISLFYTWITVNTPI